MYTLTHILNRSFATLLIGVITMNTMAHAGSSWMVINDTVMGGVSQSTVEAHPDEGVVFSGTLSLENNGGFTSVRQERTDDWSEANGVDLRVQGDGRSYIATVRLQSTLGRKIR